jgi:SynChlorMet cassette protein ScmC
VPDIICAVGLHEGKKHEILQMRMALQPIYQRIQDLGGLPLHAALVERNGFGILLAAQGGTGKTTCCRRLPSPWRALSDDEALVVKDNNQGYLVHPFPTWSDYLLERSTRTWHIQNYLPTSAIFFLEQAEADEVVTVGQGQGAALVYQSATQVCARNWINLNSEKLSMLRKRLFDNSCDLAQRTPIFKLRVSLEGKFWEEMEAILEDTVWLA